MGELEKALKEVGLKELVEAKQGKHLKNVYERLYQDALQRMQRLALILENKAKANNLYFQSVTAATKKLKGSQLHANPPDLEKLTDAAAVAIEGMWYHYDILFRRVCEHSTAQSIRDTAIDNYRLALADIFGPDINLENFEDLGSLRVPQVEDGKVRPSSGNAWGSAPAGARPFAERRICNSAGAVSPGGGIAFASQQKPKARRTADPSEKDKGDFKAYMAKMQEAGQAPATPSTELHAMRRPKSDAAARPDSLAALTLSGKRNTASLPALPKGLANLKAPPPSWLASSNHMASLQTSVGNYSGGGLDSNEGSLVLQDSWMSGDFNVDADN